MPRQFPDFPRPLGTRRFFDSYFVTRGSCDQEIELSSQRIGATGVVLLARLIHAFRSNDPGYLAKERRWFSRGMSRSAEDGVRKCIDLWVKHHDHDPESLAGAVITVKFNRGPAWDPEPTYRVEVEMKRRETNFG